MDFPDVSLVVQVGLPADADAYTHRVGRTARAGKDGRAVILLTQSESYFLSVNRKFPIQPYPASEKILNDTSAANKITNALQSVDPKSKQKAYSAYLGFMKTFTKKMQLDSIGLVKLANKFALEGMLCDELPEMERKTVGKMGLKGVPGIRIAKPDTVGKAAVKRGYPVTDSPIERDAPSRRLQHQGVPEAMDFQVNRDRTYTHSRDVSKTRGGPNVTKGEPHLQKGRGSQSGNFSMRGNEGVESKRPFKYREENKFKKKNTGQVASSQRPAKTIKIQASPE